MFLNFNLLLKNYIHISNIRKLHKPTYKLYKIVNNCYIINLVNIIANLYKLYKILFLLSKKKFYITVVNTVKLPNLKFIYYFTKFTNSNCLSTKWINGTLTNYTIMQNIIIANSFIAKVCATQAKKPLSKKLKMLQSKYNFAKYLKNIKLSKFMFLLNLDSNIPAINECLSKNKFIMGVCDLNFNTMLADLNIHGNNINHKSLNFFIKFLITPIIKGSYINLYNKR
uniref:Ribosomal protein S2 n=1 Tax=Babesia orientalis TaxID=273649 RepID=A0A0M4N382_9APIC|nr:ribosomal protein S2 [Babesia orientalis]ALE29340.1 ribosomal protein S2 [Babesia orientalis]